MNSYDSSGTDDDYPPPHQNRMGRGGHISGNGRPAPMGSMPYNRIYDETDMEAKIHELEQEAYTSVLRAFKAQADALTWDKEALITELRKELGLSNEEHSDLLKRVNGDETIQRIKEWRESGRFHSGMHAPNQLVHEPLPSPSISASRKKQKMSSTLPSQSFGGPTPPFHPHTLAAANQSTSSAAKHGSVMGAKGKKQKSIHPGSSSLKTRFPSGPGGRGHFGNRFSSSGHEPADGTSHNPLIGRKVRTRWPEDQTFYEAVITDYNPIEGLHALTYDMGTADETWEWVNLSEIPPEDIQWEGEEPGMPRHVRSGHGMNRSLGRDNAPGAGRGRGLTKGQTRKRFPPSQNGIGKRGPDDIQLLHTDSLIKEVEKVINASQPDPVEIEKAKKVLKDHEQALTDAIARLGELSDGESGEADRFLHGQPMD